MWGINIADIKTNTNAKKIIIIKNTCYNFSVFYDEEPANYTEREMTGMQL